MTGPRRSFPLAGCKVGLRGALVAIVIGGIALSATVLHLAWWRTSTAVSRRLVDALATEITDAVRREWWGVVGEVERLSQGMRDLLDQTDGASSVEGILLAAGRPSTALSWLLLVPPSGDVIAVQSLPDRALRLIRAGEGGRPVTARLIPRPHASLPEAAAPPPGRLHAGGAGWLARAGASPNPSWVLANTPDGSEQAVAFVGGTARGTLAVMIDYGRFARLLGSIAVGRTGQSFVLGPEGEVVIASAAERPPGAPGLDGVARAAAARVTARPADGKNVAEQVRLEVDGAGYAVGLSPLWFQGWQLAVIVPEAEFLAEIDTTIRDVALGLPLFLVLAGAAVAVAAQRLLADPVARIVDDLRLIERFELERVPRRRSRLREIDRLSGAIARMAAGLADFGKFIPTELVRSLVASGMRAEAGGERREITVLFADLAGFTALAERLGDEVVPVVGSFLELAARAVEAEGGTVDKFIGDAVMAFWGAPLPDEDQALRACRAALAIAAAMDAAASGSPLGCLRVRLGLNTGHAIVGNIGSEHRLNYTALGDAVNLASRLEGVNKIYGTTILLGTTTRERAGAAIRAREIDTVAVLGRREGVRVFELLGLADGPPLPLAERYAEALALYRQARFADALIVLEQAATTDGPTLWLAARCRRLVATPPSDDWKPVTEFDVK
jgi:adenylate cyclase